MKSLPINNTSSVTIVWRTSGY